MPRGARHAVSGQWRSGEVGRGRLRWVALFGVCAWAMLTGRLVQVQAWQHDSYAERAREQHERLRAVSAQRGRIVDRKDRDLALDVQAVSFYCNPSAVEDPEGGKRPCPGGKRPGAAPDNPFLARGGSR